MPRTRFACDGAFRGKVPHHHPLGQWVPVSLLLSVWGCFCHSLCHSWLSPSFLRRIKSGLLLPSPANPSTVGDGRQSKGTVHAAECWQPPSSIFGMNCGPLTDHSPSSPHSAGVRPPNLCGGRLHGSLATHLMCGKCTGPDDLRGLFQP